MQLEVLEMFGLSPGELTFVLSLMSVTVASIAWTIFDVVSWPQDVWDRAGQNRGLWIFLPLTGIVILIPPGLGIAFGIGYFAAVRPKLRHAAAQ
jgi:hypothetical protein